MPPQLHPLTDKSSPHVDGALGRQRLNYFVRSDAVASPPDVALSLQWYSGAMWCVALCSAHCWVCVLRRKGPYTAYTATTPQGLTLNAQICFRLWAFLFSFFFLGCGHFTVGHREGHPSQSHAHHSPSPPHSSLYIPANESENSK